jgi:hypothetical protein
MPKHVIRFGIRGAKGMRAATWKCWTPGGPKHDVYLACRQLNGELKASLHQSGQWHVGFSQAFYEDAFEDKTRPKMRFTDAWPRPPDIAPGITLAFRVIVPWFSATVRQGAEEPNVVWIPSATENEAVEVCILICAPETVVTDWPGKRSMGTRPIGSFPLATGEVIWIVHRNSPIQIPPPEQGTATFFKGIDDSALSDTGLRAIYFGDEPDGSRVMYDVPVKIQRNVDG